VREHTYGALGGREGGREVGGRGGRKEKEMHADWQAV